MYDGLTIAWAQSENPTSDEAALVRAAQQNPVAFGALYERYADRVYAYLRARTGSAEDASDLTQQVFVQALEALPRYRLRSVPFAAWLFRIARNLATDYHRRRRGAVAWDHIPEALHPSSTEDVAGRVERREAMGHLSGLFATLDADSREILVLRFGAELTVAEIAATIGKSKAATRMRLVRTLRALHQQYQEKYHDDPC